jgi:hypothetical protein
MLYLAQAVFMQYAKLVRYGTLVAQHSGDVVRATMPREPPPVEHDKLNVYRLRTQAIAHTGSYMFVGRPVRPI